ncbi:hypothetical protein CapIbe_024228 [Capra ibex]
METNSTSDSKSIRETQPEETKCSPASWSSRWSLDLEAKWGRGGWSTWWSRHLADMPSSSPGASVEEEGVEEILEAPFGEEDYQALLDMLPGSPGPRA